MTRIHLLEAAEKAPTKEPTSISVSEDAGFVTISIGEGTMVFEPMEAYQLGKAIMTFAEQAMRRKSGS